MRCKHTFLHLTSFTLLLLLPSLSTSATVKDVFNLNTQLTSRIPRENKYYPSRYGSNTSNLGSPNRVIKPEESPEAHDATQNPVEKRCSRCDPAYPGRDPYDYRARYDERRYRPYEYDDRRHDRYDRYDERRYDRYDRYDERDRYNRRPSYDRYDRDRYDRDPYYERERYDRDRYYDRDIDRGFGYDNRGYNRGYDSFQEQGFSSPGYEGGGRGGGLGYEGGGRGGGLGYEGGGRGGGAGYGGRPEYWGTGGYASSWNYGAGGGGGRDDGRDREPYRYDGFKPWDETYKGTSGWDSTGRGYYFASGIPEVGAEHWGSKGYLDKEKERDRYGGGGGGGYYRPRDPYDGYRSTSYLYARPSSTTTDRPNPSSADNDSSATQTSPQENSG